MPTGVYIRKPKIYKERPIVSEYSGRTKLIKAIIVNEELYDWLNQYSWHMNDNGYAVTSINVENAETTKTRMHRLIMNTPKGMVTDHLNGNRIDNRVSNLRICTQSDNMKNLKKAKGYYWDKAKGLWTVRYKLKFYGRYKTEAEAMKAYSLAKSGVPYTRKTKRNPHLPSGIVKVGNNKYLAQVQYSIKTKRLGIYPTIREAHEAYLKEKARIVS